MVRRHLPEAHNRLLEPEHTPALDVLVERRRIGFTNITGKGSPDSKADTVTVFYYVHLRVPLPKNLQGSGVFAQEPPASPEAANGEARSPAYPTSYFLMRRSSDGFVSATGMFKAAFPWASAEEQVKETAHHKKIDALKRDEEAGNIWLSPEMALKLADEYNMRAWIVALLDSAPVVDKSKEAGKKSKLEVQTPPRFELPKQYALDPTLGTNSIKQRKSDKRSVSPSKGATPGERKIASPRKRQPKKADLESVAEGSKALNKAINGAASSEEKVRVQVDETVEQIGDKEVTNTTVRVEMPAGSPELPLPESAEEMLQKAKEMVEEAKKVDAKGGRPRSSKGKRKAQAIEDDSESSSAAPKRAKVEEETKKAKVMNRTLIGISATLAVGAMVPYLANFL